ncbi:class I SAM-dependent methyltransferase [Planctomycetota bacterium]
MSSGTRCERFLRRIPILANLALFRPESYLLQRGWFVSWSRCEPVDRQGEPIPWWCYPAIEFLGGRLDQQMSVFEYGSGYSTIWTARRTGNVVSCETDEDWHDRIKPRLPSNVEYLLVPKQKDPYCDALRTRQERFDLIIIDGCYRNEIAEWCADYLREQGVILYDDSNMDCYTAGRDSLLRQGMKEIRLVGMGPCDYNTKQASVFYREANCLGI